MKNTEADVAWVKHALQGAALRVTAARVAVLKSLAAAKKPMSHAELVEELSEYGFDQSTLFRFLHEAADAGLVSRLDLGGKARRFELRKTDEDVQPIHAHFICIDCGELTSLKDFSVEVSTSHGRSHDKLGTFTEIMMRGYCGVCKSG